MDSVKKKGYKNSNRKRLVFEINRVTGRCFKEARSLQYTESTVKGFILFLSLCRCWWWGGVGCEESTVKPMKPA